MHQENQNRYSERSVATPARNDRRIQRVMVDGRAQNRPLDTGLAWETSPVDAAEPAAVGSPAPAGATAPGAVPDDRRGTLPASRSEMPLAARGERLTNNVALSDRNSDAGRRMRSLGS